MRRFLSISFCRVTLTGATSPAPARGEQTVPHSLLQLCRSCAQPPTQSSSAQDRSEGRNCNAPCAAEWGTFIYPSRNQSIPDLICIGTVPGHREDLVPHTNCSPQRDKSVLLEGLLRSSRMCLQPGISGVPKDSHDLGTLLCSAPFLCLWLYKKTITTENTTT